MRSIAYEDGGGDRALWQALAGAGWTSVTTPEEQGGAGLRFEDLIVVLEEVGRALLPLPLTTTLLAARALSGAPAESGRDQLLSQIACGELRLTLALAIYPGAAGPGACRAEPVGDGAFQLSGGFPCVAYGPRADATFVEATVSDGEQAIFLVGSDAPGASWTNLQFMDRTAPHYQLSLNGVSVEAVNCLLRGKGVAQLISSLEHEWRAALSAESLGAGQRMMELSTEYARTRVQFGRPIGANQAVKARLAEMAAAVDRLRSSIYYAAWAIDASPAERDVAVAMAKYAAGAPASLVASEAIHVHGGIGFTWEHDLHMYFKRVKSNEALLGDSSASLVRLADSIL